MSLNHITSSATVNPWMNISANDIKANTFAVSTQPFLELKLPSNLSVANNTEVALTTLTTFSSSGTGISYNSGTGLITVTSAGVYNVSYSVDWTAAANGARTGYFELFGTTTKRAHSSMNNCASDVASNTGSLSVKLLANETFYIKVLQSSGGALNATDAYISIYKSS